MMMAMMLAQWAQDVPTRGYNRHTRQMMTTVLLRLSIEQWHRVIYEIGGGWDR